MMNPKKENLKFLALTIFICFFIVSCSCESPTTPTNEQMFYDTTTTLTFDFTPVSNFEAVDFVRGVSTNLPLGAGESITRLVSSNVVTNFVTNTTNVSRVFVYITNINAVSNNFRDTDNLAGVDLSGYALAGVDFSTYDLTGAVLIGTDLSNANLSNANFSNANFSNADLRRATIIDINLVGSENTEHASWGLEFDLEGSNSQPIGIWSDGTTIWVSDNQHDKLFAYDLVSKERVFNQDFNTLDISNDTPQGIWSDGITMWVADSSQVKLYAYDLQNKTRDMSKDFTNINSNLLPGTTTSIKGSPRGVWSDGNIMWIVDTLFSKINAHSFSNKNRIPNQDFGPLMQGEEITSLSLSGIWSDGITMWIVNRPISPHLNGILVYDFVSKERVPNRDFNNLASLLPTDIWSDGTTLWILNGGTDDYVHAYNLRAKVMTP